MMHKHSNDIYPSQTKQQQQKMWLWQKPKRFWGGLDSFQIYDSTNLSRFINQFWKRKRQGLFYYIEDVTEPNFGTLEGTDK